MVVMTFGAFVNTGGSLPCGHSVRIYQDVQHTDTERKHAAGVASHQLAAITCEHRSEKLSSPQKWHLNFARKSSVVMSPSMAFTGFAFAPAL